MLGDAITESDMKIAIRNVLAPGDSPVEKGHNCLSFSLEQQIIDKPGRDPSFIERQPAGLQILTVRWQFMALFSGDRSSLFRRCRVDHYELLEKTQQYELTPETRDKLLIEAKSVYDGRCNQGHKPDDTPFQKKWELAIDMAGHPESYQRAAMGREIQKLLAVCEMCLSESTQIVKRNQCGYIGDRETVKRMIEVLSKPDEDD